MEYALIPLSNLQQLENPEQYESRWALYVPGFKPDILDHHNNPVCNAFAFTAKSIDANMVDQLGGVAFEDKDTFRAYIRVQHGQKPVYRTL